MTPRAHYPWTPDEEDYLRDNLGLVPDHAIAAHLGRTVDAISVRCKRLGISHKENVWSASDVARLFDVDRKTITTWIERGWIKGRKAPFGAGGTQAWSIDEGSVERFVRTKGWAYDWRWMIEGEYLTRLALRLHKADPWLTLDEGGRLLGLHPGTLNRWAVREGLAHQRRPRHAQAGPWASLIVVQRGVLLAYVEARKEAVHRNRSASARERARQRGWRVEAA